MAFLLGNQLKFNVPGIFAVHRPRKDILFKTKIDKTIT